MTPANFPTSLPELLDRAALVDPDRPVLVSGPDRITAGMLRDSAQSIASSLCKRGVAAGDKVILYGENSWRWVAFYHAILRAGATVVPINMLLTRAEVAYIAEDCGAAMIATSRKCAAKIEGLSLPVIGFDDLDLNDRQVSDCVSESGHSVAAICYTSGTTGQPKGAILSHRSILLNVMGTCLMHGRSSRDVIVSALPLPHVYGNVVMHSALFSGATLILLPSFDAAEILTSVEMHRATMIEGVPTMYYYLLAEPMLDRTDLSSLRLCTVGGQSMPPSAMREAERRLGCPLIELWGMTELAGLGTTHPFLGPYRHGSIGTALPFVDTKIVSLEHPFQPVGPGDLGELCVRGPIVMNGYLGQPEATSDAIQEGWLRSGDVALLTDDGLIEIVDRKKDMILTGGYNIYPAELEKILADHPAVAMSAVSSCPDPVKGEIPIAHIVTRAGCEVSAKEILAFCRERLAAYKIPRRVHFVTELPTTSTGKILRRALRESDLRDAPQSSS